ncbi:MAG: chemotaxis protein CheD [Candidatus Omnitrophica bacterium]|nr:chemotaxis protein CheD [Candidatus Omnitrophota bacterium]
MLSAKEPDTRYADIAIDEMLNKIAAQGAKKEFITAKLIGGANMFSAITSKIGEDNISYTRERLKKQGIPIVGECVGGSQGRSVEFSVASGIVTVKTKF